MRPTELNLAIVLRFNLRGRHHQHRQGLQSTPETPIFELEELVESWRGDQVHRQVPAREFDRRHGSSTPSGTGIDTA